MRAGDKEAVERTRWINQQVHMKSWMEERRNKVEKRLQKAVMFKSFSWNTVGPWPLIQHTGISRLALPDGQKLKTAAGRVV